MGTSSSPVELSHKLTRLNGELREIPREAVGAAALRVKKSVLAVAPDRLRNVGKKGAKLSVSYKVANTVAEGDAYAFVSANGPWPLIERDTPGHTIRPKHKRASGGRRAAIIVPPHGFFASAKHPGTKGKHPWAKGVAIAKPKVQAEFRGTLGGALRKVF